MHLTMTNEGLLMNVRCRLAEPMPALVVAGTAYLEVIGHHLSTEWAEAARRYAAMCALMGTPTR